MHISILLPWLSLLTHLGISFFIIFISYLSGFCPLTYPNIKEIIKDVLVQVIWQYSRSEHEADEHRQSARRSQVRLRRYEEASEQRDSMFYRDIQVSSPITLSQMSSSSLFSKLLRVLSHSLALRSLPPCSPQFTGEYYYSSQDEIFIWATLLNFTPHPKLTRK